MPQTVGLSAACRTTISPLLLTPNLILQCVSKTTHYNFDKDQTILTIFGRDVAERVCYQTVISYPTSPN